MEEGTIVKIRVTSPEAKTKLDELIERDGEMEIYSPRDEMERLSMRVRNLGAALRAFKQSGINWNVFIRYMRGCGISQTQIDKVMGGVEAFFEDFDVDID